VYRDTAEGEGQTISIPHIDFYRGRDSQGLWGVIDVSRLIGVELLNVWFSLEESGITDNNLAVLDTRTLSSSDIFSLTTTTKKGLRFKSGAIRYNPHHSWYSKQGLRLGQGYAFLSRKTPHTAYRLSPEKRRRSIEFRVIVSKSRLLTGLTTMVERPLLEKGLTRLLPIVGGDPVRKQWNIQKSLMPL